jgi:tRNA dimethylallyltransferase
LTIPEINKKKLIVILGPTASGKTAAAVDLAVKLGTEVISADSRQFYREMRIGTARPTEEQLTRARHHFVGHLSVSDAYNVARFEQDALRVLGNIFQHQRYAILVGGSGLYIDAVCKGIDELPDPEPELRRQLRKEFESEGLSFMQQRLAVLDPEYFREVDLQNPNRVLRALEVCIITGKPYSSFRKHQQKPRDFEIVKFGLDLPRDVMNRQIDARVDEMMKLGLLEEARSLYPFRHLNALNTVGYKELFEYLEGRCTLQLAIERIKTSTRRYAKRQVTWFRKDREIQWVRDWQDIRIT